MKKEIELKPKKPRLAYVGMEKITPVEAVPTQVIEVIYPSLAEKKDERSLFAKGELQRNTEKENGLPKNRLIWTNDNLVALKTLLDERDPVSGEYRYRGKVDLIYIDPPFMVQDDFVTSNSVEIDVSEEKGVSTVKEPTVIEMLAYKDTWEHGLDSFLQMMRERLLVMKDLLSGKGSIYVHLDWHTSHYIKVLMDEIFGYANFQNEITWHYRSFHGQAKSYFPRKHDSVLFYKTGEAYFRLLRDESVAVEDLIDYKNWGKYIVNGNEIRGNNMPTDIRFKRNIDQFVKKMGRQPGPDDVVYVFQSQPYDDVWDIPYLDPKDTREKTGYPTQKPMGLLERVIKSSCPPGGIILDAFVGSGTTCEAAEQLADELNCSWIGIDNSKFAIHTARKRLIELNGKPKEKKGKGVHKVRPFTVENIGYYQRGVRWDPIQVGKQADAYRKAIVELFGGESVTYSKLLHGKKRGAWVHVGPLSAPVVSEQIIAISEEVKDTELRKCYVLSADFTASYDREGIKKGTGVDVMVRVIPASAIDEVKKRLQNAVARSQHPERYGAAPNIAFFAPLTVRVRKTVDGKQVMIELAGCEVDVESFLESQKPERRKELEKWLKRENSWQSFVDFWAVDWQYEDRRDELGEPIFENEWQSFRKRKGKKIVEDLVYKAFHTYDKPGEYTVAVKVTDVFGNDGITTLKVAVR